MFTIQTRKTRRLVGLASLALALTIFIGRAYIPTPVAWAIFLAVLALGAIWTRAYWRHIGEVARDGQKTAWLWGGILGLGAAIFLMAIPAAYPLIGATIDWVDTSPGIVNASFVAGVLWAFAAQMIGFALYWAYWWIAKR